MRELLSVLEERLEDPTVKGLVASVTAAIREGVLTPGTRLPPIRTVAVELGLSPTTVNAAWGLLARSGMVRTDGRRGTTVTDVRTGDAHRYRHAVQARPDLAIDLSTGVPDRALLPTLDRALAGLTATAGTPSSYLDQPVLPELTDVLAADWPYPAPGFLVTDGAMDAIELIARTLFSFGDRVVVEHPVFPPLLDLLESVGVQVVGVALDEQGPIVADLADALRAPAVAVVLQPRAQNPTGISLTRARAAELAGLLAQHDCLVVEDDSAGAVAWHPALSLGRWLPERTLHVRSYSKSHGPDLRLASVSGPADLVARLSGRRQLGQGWSSRLLQRILLHMLTDPHATAQVAAARTEYRRRRRAAVAALAARGIECVGDDGINLWVPVVDEAATLVRLASQGIGVAPGAPFAVLADRPGHIRVTVGLLPADGGDGADVLDKIGDAALVALPWGRVR